MYTVYSLVICFNGYVTIDAQLLRDGSPIVFRLPQGGRVEGVFKHECSVKVINWYKVR